MDSATGRFVCCILLRAWGVLQVGCADGPLWRGEGHPVPMHQSGWPAARLFVAGVATVAALTLASVLPTPPAWPTGPLPPPKHTAIAQRAHVQATARALPPLAYTPPARSLNVRLTPPPPGAGPPTDIADVHFTTPVRGFGVTYSGRVYRTDDAGTSWRQLYQVRGARLMQADFSDAETGFVVGSTGCLPGPNCTGPALVLRTIDGGHAWQALQPRGLTREMEHVFPFLHFAFASARAAYALPDPDEQAWPIAGLLGHILRTVDGGRHWRTLPLPRGCQSSGGISFLTPAHGFITATCGTSSGKGTSQVLATTDGGQHWRPSYTTAFPLYAVQFLDARHGVTAGGWGGIPEAAPSPTEVVLATSDGGATWTPVYRYADPRGGLRVTRVHFVSPAVGWAALGHCNMLGANGPCGGPLLFTTDGGRAWSSTGRSVVRFNSVGRSAWYVDGAPLAHAPSLLNRTTDGGLTWQTPHQPAAVTVDQVQFASPRVGWIGANIGFYRTTDGGAHWAHDALGAPVTPADPLVFISRTNVFAYHYHSAYQGTKNPGGSQLLHSTDGGRTWQPVPLPLPGNVDRRYATLAFVGPRNGWIALPTFCHTVYSCPEILLATTDGAQTWRQLTPGLPAPTYADTTVLLSFGDDRHGAGLSDDGTELELTNDGGSTWSTVRLTAGFSPASVSRVGAADIWLVGGSVSHSTDGGQHWTAYRSGAFTPTNVSFVTPMDGWLIGDTGRHPSSLLVTHDGGQTWQQVWPVVAP